MESKVCNLSNMWTKKMPEGLGLEITHQPPSMRHIVNLIIAMERLKAGVSEKVLSTDFRDENLISIMLESVLEEKHIFESHSDAPDQYHRFKELECSITDSNQRSLVLIEASMELHAMTLQGGSGHHKILLNMAMYTHGSSTPSPNALLVALGIKGTDFYLSCHQKDNTPTLHLEVVDKENLSNIDSKSEMKRFLFYKQDTSVNISTLVSASFPKWYISTSTQDKRPVEMCQETDDRYRNFKIQPQS